MSQSWWPKQDEPHLQTFAMEWGDKMFSVYKSASCCNGDTPGGTGNSHHDRLSLKTGMRQLGDIKTAISLNSMNSWDFADSHMPEFVRLLCA
jgi:hypothetical protein